MDYPVLEILDDLKAKLAQSTVVILQAPPGAGKSTVLPLRLLDESWLAEKKIVMLEPRRLAARSVANRMASSLEEKAGETVGYRIRFDTLISSKTRIEVVTEGILTRLIQQDNTLQDVGLVVFDEFHERSLQGDLALALCLQAQQLVRDDLRILIMSATLETEKLAALLGNAPVVTSEGRQFAVELRYDGFDPDAYIHIRMARAIRKALSECNGDVLAFLPGAGEIIRTREFLESSGIGAMICVLYGDLPMKQQQEALLPFKDGRRKVVLATSIAETSLTIEGISIVVDSGYARVPKFDPRSGLTRLSTVRVSKDAADQRAGRAGRLGPGVCYRLWNEGLTGGLVAHRIPEILEADLSGLILELSQWGVRDLNEVLWMTKPPAGAVNQAKELLEGLEALQDGKITARGRKMLQLPTHPRIAHMLIEAVGDTRSLSLAADLAALLEERDPLSRDAGADLTLRLEAFRKWRSGEKAGVDRNSVERIERLAQSWRKIFKLPIDNQIPAESEVGKLLAGAYPERIARQVENGSERYKLANGRMVKLPSHDPLAREKWLAVAHLDAGNGEGRIYLAAPLDENDLMHLAHETESVVWDAQRKMVVGNLEKRIGNLVLKTKSLPVIPDEKRVKVICDLVRREGLRVLGWTDSHTEWQSRVMSVRAWRQTEAWPDVSEIHLLETVEQWLPPYLLQVRKLSELQNLDMQTILSGILTWPLVTRLDSLAPAKLNVPSGSSISLKYFSDGQPPILEVRLQEVLGLAETPMINEGKTKIVMHLLSPGYKPVQVTQDLKSFWATIYHEVRNELRRRYPKHSWPDDPWTAPAVRGARRRT